MVIVGLIWLVESPPVFTQQSGPQSPSVKSSKSYTDDPSEDPDVVKSLLALL